MRPKDCDVDILHSPLKFCASVHHPFPSPHLTERFKSFQLLLHSFLFTTIIHYSYCNCKCVAFDTFTVNNMIFCLLNRTSRSLAFMWHQLSSTSLENFKDTLSLNTVKYLERKIQISFLLFLLSFNHAEFSLPLA